MAITTKSPRSRGVVRMSRTPSTHSRQTLTQLRSVTAVDVRLTEDAIPAVDNEPQPPEKVTGG
jgi:hypothetical protein